MTTDTVTLHIYSNSCTYQQAVTGCKLLAKMSQVSLQNHVTELKCHIQTLYWGWYSYPCPIHSGIDACTITTAIYPQITPTTSPLFCRLNGKIRAIERVILITATRNTVTMELTYHNTPNKLQYTTSLKKTLSLPVES